MADFVWTTPTQPYTQPTVDQVLGSLLGAVPLGTPRPGEPVPGTPQPPTGPPQTSDFNVGPVLPPAQGGDLTIPEGTYPYTHQVTALPEWAQSSVEATLGSLTSGLPSNIGAQLWSRASRPFAWWDKLPKNRDWFSGAMQGTRNQLLDQLHSQLQRGTVATSAQLAARGLPMMTAAAAPSIWNQALSNYATQMALTDRWAAERAAQLANWMAEQDYREKMALASALSAITGGVARMAEAARTSTMEQADPLAPYRLLLGV